MLFKETLLKIQESSESVLSTCRRPRVLIDVAFITS